MVTLIAMKWKPKYKMRYHKKKKTNESDNRERERDEENKAHTIIKYEVLTERRNIHQILFQLR